MVDAWVGAFLLLAALWNGWVLRWWWVNVAEWPAWPARDWPEGGLFRFERHSSDASKEDA